MYVCYIFIKQNFQSVSKPFQTHQKQNLRQVLNNVFVKTGSQRVHAFNRCAKVIQRNQKAGLLLFRTRLRRGFPMLDYIVRRLRSLISRLRCPTDARIARL